MNTSTGDQIYALENIERWWLASGSNEFRMGGLAGTGKTTIIAQLPALLGLNNVDLRYVAPTGKAANVLTRKLKPHGFMATTLHRLMYLPREYHCTICTDRASDTCHGQGDCGCHVSFEWRIPDPRPKLVVVDEASMVTAQQHADLMIIGCKVLYVGDHGQLPPVMGNIGLMDEDNLDVKLERIHRQVADSPILQLAMQARHGKDLDYGTYGYGVRVVPFKGYEIEADADTMILCYTNGRRMRMNELMRRALHLPAQTPVAGDKVLCLKNNPDAGVSNGTLGVLQKISGVGRLRHLVIDIADEKRTYSGVALAEQFGSANTMLVRGIDLWTFGYCLTAHKAQGSEADDVIVFREGRVNYMSADDQRRWLYTAITRAKHTLTVVK